MNEHDYAKPLHGYLNQDNSDGSDPEGEARDLVAIAMNILAGGALFAIGIAAVLFVIQRAGG